MAQSDNFQMNLNDYKERLRDAFSYLLQYLKNPVDSMRQLPDWDWGTLVLFYASLCAAFGVLGGIVSARISQIFIGLIFFPISACIGIMLVSGFFYYTFVFFFKNEVNFKLIATTLIFASFPTLALNVLSPWVPLIGLVGGAVTCVLLVVGFTESTRIPREKITKLMLILFGVMVLMQITTLLSTRSDKERIKDIASPESINIIKKEFGQ